jgi:hypothetical protein
MMTVALPVASPRNGVAAFGGGVIIGGLIGLGDGLRVAVASVRGRCKPRNLRSWWSKHRGGIWMERYYFIVEDS